MRDGTPRPPPPSLGALSPFSSDQGIHSATIDRKSPAPAPGPCCPRARPALGFPIHVRGAICSGATRPRRAGPSQVLPHPCVASAGPRANKSWQLAPSASSPYSLPRRHVHQHQQQAPGERGRAGPSGWRRGALALAVPCR